MPPPRSRRFCRTSMYSGRICVTKPKIKGANSGRLLTKRLSIKRWLMLRLVHVIGLWKLIILLKLP